MNIESVDTGQDLITEPTAAAQDANSQDRDFESEIAKLRKEAAKHRTEKNEFKKQLDELKPIVDKFKAQQEAEMSEAEKLKAQLEELKEARAQAELEAKQSKLMAYGVPESALELINVAALDWNDTDALKEKIAVFTQPKGPSASTPGPAGVNGRAITSIDDLRGMSQEEIRANIGTINAALTPKRQKVRL